MTPPATVSFGRMLFRFRSVTPLPVLALVLWLLWQSRGIPTPAGPEFDRLLDQLGLGLCLLGEVVRFYVTGWVPEGTSGQNNRLEAAVLNTRGPYAWVRNPLYLGNLLLVLGLLSLAGDPWAAAVGLTFFFGEYYFIIRAEEDFLRARFSHAFEDYCAKVRRWVPRTSSAFPGALREGSFDWRRALKKEHNPTLAWFTGALALLAWGVWTGEDPRPATLWSLAAAELAALVAFFWIKRWKHSTPARRAGDPAQPSQEPTQR